MNILKRGKLFLEGSFGGRIIVVVFLIFAFFAFIVPGSIYHATQSVFEGGTKAAEFDFNDFIKLFFSAFLNDIIGQPGIFVSSIKTVLAIVMAFLVANYLPIARGSIIFKGLGIELSGVQSKAIFWCIVFILVRDLENIIIPFIEMAPW